MSLSTWSAIAFLVVLTIQIHWTNAVVAYYSIDSATSLKDYRLALFSGKQALIFKQSKYIGITYNKFLDTMPPGSTIKACIGSNEGISATSSAPTIYYSNAYIYKFACNDGFNYFNESSDYTLEDTFIQNGAPDAAVRRRYGQMVYFKGCYMAINYGNNQWSTPLDIRHMNLTCGIDAAWSIGFDAMLLKLDKVWLWKSHGSIEGPYNFCDYYDCDGQIALHAFPPP